MPVLISRDEAQQCLLARRWGEGGEGAHLGCILEQVALPLSILDALAGDFEIDFALNHWYISTMKKSAVTVTCGNCEKPFETHLYRLKNGTGKYCNRACYLAARWKRQASCERCGTACEHRFCSEQCRVDHWNENGHAIHKHPSNWRRKLALMSELGGVCVKCGESDYRVLDIDHIDRSKKTGRPRAWNYRFKDWAANKGNLRLLCANCHRLHTWDQMGYGPVHAASPSINKSP